MGAPNEGRRMVEILKAAQTHIQRQLTIECRSVGGCGYTALVVPGCVLSDSFTNACSALAVTPEHPPGPFSACTLSVKGCGGTMLEDHLS